MRSVMRGIDLANVGGGWQFHMLMLGTLGCVIHVVGIVGMIASFLVIVIVVVGAQHVIEGSQMLPLIGEWRLHLLY